MDESRSSGPLRVASLEEVEAPDGPILDLPPSLSRIASLLVCGHSDKQIAALTGLSHTTVRTYVRRLYTRTGVRSRVELVHRVRGVAPQRARSRSHSKS